MLGSVTQACRTLHSGDEKYGFRCRRVPFILTSFCLAPFGNENGLKCRLKVSYCTLGRRKCTEVLLKRVVRYSRATKSMGFVAEESPSSLRHSVSHLWATKKRGSVTQACRTLLSGDEKYGFRCRRVPFILTSFCPTPTGNKNGRKCCLKVSCCTLGRRKVWILLPKSPFILTSFCLAPFGNENGLKCRLKVSYCTLGRRKCSEVSPKRAVSHSRVTILG